MKFFLTILFAMVLASCMPTTQKQTREVIGTVVDFEIIMGAFRSNNYAIVTLADGSKISFVYHGEKLRTGKTLYHSLLGGFDRYEVLP